MNNAHIYLSYVLISMLYQNHYQFYQIIKYIIDLQLSDYEVFETGAESREAMLLATSCSFAPASRADSMRPVYILASDSDRLWQSAV